MRVFFITTREKIITMKKIQTALVMAILGVGVIFVGTSATSANTNSAVTAAQIVPAAKQVGKATYKAGKRGGKAAYRGGRWVTVRVYRGGKWVTKKVWRGGKRVVMGKPKRNP